MFFRRLGALGVSLALLAAACGGGDGDAGPLPGAPSTDLPADTFAIRASTDLAVGPDRLLIGLAAPDDQRLGSPDLPVTIEVFPEADPDSVQIASGSWIWAVPDQTGLYRAVFEFDQPGIWLARVVPDGSEPLELVPFQVNAVPSTPAVGSPAPPSETPTGAEFPLTEITTDRNPDPRFYELSVADAVSSGRPSVIVFATPLFCRTAICGPTLDGIKTIAADHPDVNWVHVEVYTGFNEPDFQPDAAHLRSAVLEWGLPSEPWVFVVDSAGIVRARYEGVADRAEIAEALASVD